METEFDLSKTGEYLAVPFTDPGYKIYNGKPLPKNRTYDRVMYTFAMPLQIDKSLAGQELCLFVGNIDWPVNLYLNGSLIFKKGSITPSNYNSMNYGFDNVILPAGLIDFSPGSVNIIQAQGFPMRETYPLPEMFISTYRDVESLKFLRNLFTIHLIQGAVVMGIILFFYFSLLFLGMKKRDMKYLYIALISLFYSMGQMNIALSQNFSNEVFLEQLSRTGLPLSSITLALFLLEFAGFLKKKVVIKSFIFIPPALFSLVTLFMDTKQSISDYFNLSTYFVILPMLFFTISVSLIAIFRKPERRRDILVILGSIFLLIAASVHDFIFLWSAGTPFAWLNPYGYILLVFTLFFIQAREQAKLYEQSIVHSVRIGERNEILSKLIENLKMISENLNNSSGKLNNNIESSSDLLDWYESSTEQITEIMQNKFVDIKSLISGITETIKRSSERVPKAIQNQTSLIGQVKATIAENERQSINVTNSVIETNRAAQDLAHLAERSVEVLNDSRKAIGKISEYSSFILNVLKSMEEITDRSSTLAINASIEAVKAGRAGEGFSVVAKEMRNLSKETKVNLESSVKKIKELAGTVSKSIELSDQVGAAIKTIIESTRESARMINQVNELIGRQREDFSGITDAAVHLYDDALTIKKLSEEDVAENNQIVETMQEFGDSFNSIIDMLTNQKNMQIELEKSMTGIRGVMEENIRLVEVLNENISLSDGTAAAIREKD
jgi:methyl-accepting chemotaxis protein